MCGVVILLCIGLVPVSASFNIFPYSTLTLEALALFAFGIAWLIKGRALGDKGKIGEKLYREQNAENNREGTLTVIVSKESKSK